MPWNQLPRAARCGIDERARSPGRLLEESTESAHSFHPVRSIEPQPIHDWGQVIRYGPALIRAKFPPSPIEQLFGHTIGGGDAKGWTILGGRLGATDRIGGGGRDWPVCDADSCAGEAALTTLVDAGPIAVSYADDSQSQPSGRSLVSGELCSSVGVNLVEISSKLRIRSHPEV